MLRGGEVVWQGPCTSMRRRKSEVKTAERGTECGVVLDGGRFDGMRPGDVVQSVQSS